MSNEENKIVVKIDEDLEELIPGYLENRHHDIAKIKTALEEGDYETIRILGHGMKGSGSGYGFEQISEIGSNMEQAAITQDSGQVTELLTGLEDYLARVEIIYE